MLSSTILTVCTLAALAQGQTITRRQYTQGFDYFANTTEYDIGNDQGITWANFYPNNQQKGFNLVSKPTIAFITGNQTKQAQMQPGSNPPGSSFNLQSLYFVCAKSAGPNSFPSATPLACTVDLVGTSSYNSKVRVTQTLTYTPQSGNTNFTKVAINSAFVGKNITNIAFSVTNTATKNKIGVAALFDNVQYVNFESTDDGREG